jgi:hypothetical protein
MMALMNMASVLLSEVGPETPVMDLMWWAWLLIVFVSIVVVGLAIAWQAHLVKPPQAEHGEGEAEHHEA